MTLRATLLLSIAVALGCAPPCPSRERAVVHPRASSPGASPVAAAADDDPGFSYELVPGCSEAAASALREEVKRIDADMAALDDGADPAPLRARIGAVWQAPCMAHFARLFTPPPTTLSAKELKALWRPHLERALRASVGGVYVRDGKRYIFAPPVPVPGLPPATAKALAPWLCAASDASGARADGYVHRAELAFASRALIEASHAGRNRGEEDDACADPLEYWRGDPKPTLFEAWAVCELGRARYDVHYPRVRWRAPEKGWLVLRGRRGHYSFADEIRAYDLATGAAYVVSSASAVVLDGPGVNFAATDGQRQLDAFTGTVAPDQARELAFALVTLDAPQESRDESTPLRVPDAVPFTLSPEGVSLDQGNQHNWATSAQSRLDFELVDGGQVLAEGSLTFPDAWRRSESYANDLLAVLEAGLARGCAPARLPKLARGLAPVSALDADASRQSTVADDLDAALRALAKNACRGAK
jgi:hypothetical protein